MTVGVPDNSAEIWKTHAGIAQWLANADSRERKRVAQRLFVAQMLPFDEQDAFTLLDLGAGTGAAARGVLSVYPNAKAVLADWSPQMMEAGVQAMAPYADRYRYVELDLTSETWPDELPSQVGAAVTSMCIHHIPDSAKRNVFRQVYQRLAPGGWYLNMDPVVATDPAVEAVWERVSVRMDPSTVDSRHPKTEEARIRRANHVRYMIDLDLQLGYLREAGFAAVDVYWKQLDMVIYGGCRAG
jgi:tRNA (cmo5U34)-methyltransferase